MNNLTPEQENFLVQSSALFTEAHKKAAVLDPNTVQVWPGGATFSSIQEAIDSIHMASEQLQFQVAVGPGTYNEVVTLKPFVFVSGAGEQNTMITAYGSYNYASGTVQAAGDSGISDLSIQSVGSGTNSTPIGIKLISTGTFHASAITFKIQDSGQTDNKVRGITNIKGAPFGLVILGRCVMELWASMQSEAVAVEGSGYGMYYHIDLGAIGVGGTGNGTGVYVTDYAKALLTSATVSASDYALYMATADTEIVAKNCTLDGKVSNGVIVINDEMSAEA